MDGNHQLAPEIPKSGKLSQVKASEKMPSGIVRSAWTLKAGVFIWEFTVPANVTAEVRIPADKGAVIKGTERMKLLRTQEDCAVYQAGAGSYSVQSRIGAQMPASALAIPPVQPAKPVQAVKAAPPAAAAVSGNTNDWAVSTGSKASIAEGAMQVSAGTQSTVILTTRLPKFSGGNAQLTLKMKTPASGKGMVRMVSENDGKKASQVIEFDLGVPGEWKEYVMSLPPFKGSPFSLWIGLKTKEEMVFSAIRLETMAGQLLKSWVF